MTVVVEDDLAGVDAAVAELFELAADREAVAFFGDEQAHAAVARLGVGSVLTSSAKHWPSMALVIHVLVPLTT